MMFVTGNDFREIRNIWNVGYAKEWIVGQNTVEKNLFLKNINNGNLLISDFTNKPNLDFKHV